MLKNSKICYAKCALTSWNMFRGKLGHFWDKSNVNARFHARQTRSSDKRRKLYTPCASIKHSAYFNNHNSRIMFAQIGKNLRDTTLVLHLSFLKTASFPNLQFNKRCFNKWMEWQLDFWDVELHLQIKLYYSSDPWFILGFMWIGRLY